MDDPATRPLFPLPGEGELELRRPSWKSNLHLLYAGDALVGRYDRRTMKEYATAESARGAWTFTKAGGLFSSALAVADAATGAELATYKAGWTGRGGLLRFADGARAYRLQGRGFAQRDWRFTPEGDEETLLVAIRLHGDLGEVKAEARVTAAGVADPDATLLVLLGCHVALRARRQASAAGAGAATSVAATG